MPKITEVGGRIRYSIERFDGGLNTKDSPSKIGPFESPDCLNVVFDDEGSVWTRDGSKIFNTSIIGSLPVVQGANYQGTMVVWANNQMHYASGTTMVPITSTSGKFNTSRHIAYKVYQNVLFASDGVNGPWKWTGGENFYNMGIDKPSAPTGASIGGGSLSTGTYYYGISFVNSQVVEGEIGSISVAVTTTNSSTVRVSSIPVGSGLAGVAQRFIYRAEAASGPFRRVGVLANNTTTTFDDTVANGAEGKSPVLDGSKPTPFNTIEQHKELLFFDDSTNKSLMRWTNFGNPYISEAENFEPISNGDGEDIVLIAGQDNFLNAFKSNKSFSFLINDPSDFTTWVKTEVPANIGVVGPEAFCKIQNGILFIGKQNNRMTGVHFINGLKVIDSDDGRLRTNILSEKVEYDFLNGFNSSQLDKIYCCIYQNRLHLAYPANASTTNNRIFWFDLNRVGTKGQPGSWAPWTGINAACLFVFNGLLYSGDATSTGYVRQLYANQYSDSGTAINSYFWTKEIGGEDDGTLDGYVKDLREMYLWYAKLGNYNMNVGYRLDGDSGSGSAYTIDLNPGGSTWGSMIWGTGLWGGTRSDFVSRITVGRVLARRFQFRFDNQNTVNQAFKVHRLEIGMNLRRRR
jgi:hypothetical protein